MLSATDTFMSCRLLLAVAAAAAQRRQAPRLLMWQWKTRRMESHARVPRGSAPSKTWRAHKEVNQFRLYRRGAVAANNVAASGFEFVSSEWNMAPSSGF